MQEINRILVVSRITKNCQESLKYAIALAWKYSAELFVLHIGPDPLELQELESSTVCSNEELADAFVNAKSTLDGILRCVRVGGLSVTEMIKEGNPVEEIMKAIGDKEIDCLVLRHPDETRLDHFLFDRINEELNRQRPCLIMFKEIQL
ncbi:MAG: universal stress protein [Desulfuromonadales bacterium]|nr:universal stress protein [Desulfuromonadales bacterium]